MADYQERLNIPDNPFGIEIEFAGVRLEDVYYKLDKTIKNLIFCENNKDSDTQDYEKWCIKDDITVRMYDVLERLGGEITTPIMYNKKRDWQELKYVCETLKEMEGIKINGYCSVHIHTDKHIYKCLQEYINLLKLWMLYEDVIYRFGYGEEKYPRISITRYAKSISYYIYGILDKLNKVQTEEELIHLLRYERTLGLNLTNILKQKQTIENRIFNGTLNEIFIQKCVLFNQNLLNYAKVENFDEEFIKYKIKKYTPIFINESLIEKKEKEEELINLIVKEKEDKQKLLRK